MTIQTSMLIETSEENRGMRAYEFLVPVKGAACDNCLADLIGKATRIEVSGMNVDLCNPCMVALRDAMRLA